MVSFFGLKIGGDKKKKHEKQTQEPPQFKPIEPIEPIEPNGPGGRGYLAAPNLGRPFGDGMGGGFDIRPQTSHSTRGSRSFSRPYAANTAAASSMVDLSAPPRIFQGHGQKSSVSSLSSLLHVGSEFDQFRRAWADGSIPSSSGPDEEMEPPRPVESPRRPESPWRNRPESPFRTRAESPFRKRAESPFRKRAESPFRTRAESPFRTEAPRRAEGLRRAESPSPSPRPSEGQKSPKRDWGDQLDPDTKSPLSHLEFVPVSPMSTSNEESPITGNEQTDYFAKGYPSPPPSLRSVNGDAPAPKVRNNPSGLRQVSNAPPRLGGPASLPSPANSSERSSEEERQAPLWNGPVIQDVEAKRETISSYYGISSRPQSLSMDIDQTEKSILAEFNFNDYNKAGMRSPTKLYDAKPSDPSEFAAFNFNDDRPSTSHGANSRRKKPETDFSGFDFTDERPKTSAGPRPRGDLPAPLKIHKELPNSQFQAPNSPFIQSPMRAPGLERNNGGWAMDGPKPDNRPRGDRILPATGPAAMRQPPPQPRTQEDELDLEPLDPPGGYFGSTGPRSSRADSFFDGPPDSPFARYERCPSRDSMRAPSDLERSFDPRLRRAEKPKPRSPSPSSVYDSQPNSPNPSPPTVVLRTRPVDITEARSPLDDLFKDSRGDLDLSFSFPGQAKLPSAQPPNNFPSPRVTNQTARGGEWPLASPTSIAPPELPRPGFTSESRPYTPPSLRNYMARTDPPLEPPPRAPTRTASPMGPRIKMPPPPRPPQMARDRRMDPSLRAPTGVADNFGTAFI